MYTVVITEFWFIEKLNIAIESFKRNISNMKN